LVKESAIDMVNGIASRHLYTEDDNVVENSRDGEMSLL